MRTFKFFLSSSISILLPVIWYIVISYNHHVILLILRPYLITESLYSFKNCMCYQGDSFSGLKLILGLDYKFTERIYNVILLIVLVEMWDIWVVLGACEYINFKKLFYLCVWDMKLKKYPENWDYWGYIPSWAKKRDRSLRFLKLEWGVALLCTRLAQVKNFLWE